MSFTKSNPFSRYNFINNEEKNDDHLNILCVLNKLYDVPQKYENLLKTQLSIGQFLFLIISSVLGGVGFLLLIKTIKLKRFY